MREATLNSNSFFVSTVQIDNSDGHIIEEQKSEMQFLSVKFSVDMRNVQVEFKSKNLIKKEKGYRLLSYLFFSRN